MLIQICIVRALQTPYVLVLGQLSLTNVQRPIDDRCLPAIF
jgi:hypothetical protein